MSSWSATRMVAAGLAAASLLFAQDSIFGLRHLRKVKGMLLAGPKTVKHGGSGEDIDFRVRRGGEPAIIEILISDERTPVSLRLPDGEVLSRVSVKDERAEWKTVTGRADDGDDGYGFGPPLLTGEGVHHVIALRRTVPGLYRIHIDSRPATDVSVRAAFIPEKAMQQAFEAAFQIPPYPTDHVELYVAPPETALAGEILHTSAISFAGPLDRASPVTIEMSAAYESDLATAGLTSPEKKADQFRPVARIVTQDYTKVHSLSYVPPIAGVLHVHFRAFGRMSSGRSFVSERELSWTISDAVAHFIELAEHALQASPSQRASSLEIAARLHVRTPGEYYMAFALSDGGGRSLYLRGSERLEAGDRLLAISIPAEQMLRLDDGPYKISALSIHRGRYYPPSEAVQIDSSEFFTAAYKRSDWDRGTVYGVDTIDWRGADVTATGQFGALQIEWQAVTPGGSCQWYGLLSPTGGGKTISSEFTVRNLEAGRHVLTFRFPGLGIGEPRVRSWSFLPVLNCGNIYAKTWGRPFHLTIDPNQFH